MKYIKRIQLGKNKLSFLISNMPMTLLFLDGRMENLRNLVAIIHCFELVFGMKINWQKNCFVDINSNQEDYKEIFEALNCSICKFPIEYIGVPLGGKPKKKDFWLHVVERCKKKLSTWKANYLSSRKHGHLPRPLVSVLDKWNVYNTDMHGHVWEVSAVFIIFYFKIMTRLDMWWTRRG